MECSYSHACRDSINIKQIEPTIKPFFFSFDIASQLCFLLLYSAFCSWDSAYDISIFTSGSILPSEDRAWERKTAKLEKEKRTPFCLLFWAFSLLVSIIIVVIAIVPSYSMSWTQGAAFPTGSDLVSFTSKLASYLQISESQNLSCHTSEFREGVEGKCTPSKEGVLLHRNPFLHH